MSKDIRFKNYLFRLRRVRRLSQKQLAGLVGLRSRETIALYESGQRLPSLRTALLIEIVLGARLAEIYLDLYRELGLQAVQREARLPGGIARHIRGRVLGKD